MKAQAQHPALHPAPGTSSAWRPVSHHIADLDHPGTTWHCFHQNSHSSKSVKRTGCSHARRGKCNSRCRCGFVMHPSLMMLSSSSALFLLAAALSLALFRGRLAAAAQSIKLELGTAIMESSKALDRVSGRSSPVAGPYAPVHAQLQALSFLGFEPVACTCQPAPHRSASMLGMKGSMRKGSTGYHSMIRGPLSAPRNTLRPLRCPLPVMPVVQQRRHAN